MFRSARAMVCRTDCNSPVAPNCGIASVQSVSGPRGIYMSEKSATLADETAHWSIWRYNER